MGADAGAQPEATKVRPSNDSLKTLATETYLCFVSVYSILNGVVKRRALQ